MLPHEKAMVKKLADKPFALLGINSDGDRSVVKPKMVTENVTWRQFMDGTTSGPIATKWNIHGWPTIFVLDHKGVIRFKNLRGEKLEEAVEKLLAEQEAEQKSASH